MVKELLIPDEAQMHVTEQAAEVRAKRIPEMKRHGCHTVTRYEHFDLADRVLTDVRFLSILCYKDQG
jgi:hypothetical protein